MAVFVSMDKSVALDPGYVSFVSATNSKTFRYVKAEAEKVFATYEFGAEDATSMLEMAAMNHEGEGNVLSETELEGGAAGLVAWKEHEAARAEEERKRKAAEAARAQAEYEAAKAAAEEEERKRKEAEDAAARAEAEKPKPKKSSGFGGFLGRATAMAQDAVQIAKAAGEAAFAEGEKLYNERKAKLAELKLKAEAAEAENAAPAKPLTFYEKMQLQAKKSEKALDDYRQMTDMAVSKGIYTGEAEANRIKRDREAESKE